MAGIGDVDGLFHVTQTVEAELRVPIATAQLASFNAEGPSENVFYREDEYWLDLCLTPRHRNARARYREHWGPNRFQRLGTVMLMPAGQCAQLRADAGGRQSSIVCILRPEPVRAWFEGDLVWTDRRLESCLDISSANIRSLLLRLGEELRHPGFASESLAELIAAQMAIELSRYCAAIADGPATGGLAPWRLRLIDERLNEVREAPTLAELAGLCNLSVRQLTRGFRTSRGCSIGDYIANSRVDVAKQLLAGDESVKAIAYSMGFSSPSGFSYAFRRSTGETPRAFRQRMLCAA
jgi:AraC family transcriptional regulator